MRNSHEGYTTGPTNEAKKDESMNWLHQLRLRFRALFQKEQLDAQMDEEMRSHIEMQTQENIEAGMKPEEARYAALRQFGRVEAIKETCRDQRGLPALETFWQDLRYGARQLRKNPGFTAVAVLTLALGIGANTAIFSLVNAVFFRPITAHEPDRLVSLFNQEKENPANFRFFSHPNFKSIQAESLLFEDVLAFAPGNVAVTDGELSRSVGAVFVSANYFSVLGVSPAQGRGFMPEEESSPTPVAVLSHAYWQRSGSDAGIIGQVIRLNNTAVTVVGVMPEYFTGTMALAAPAFFLPLGLLDPLTAQPGAPTPNTFTDRGAEKLSLVARLRPGLSSSELPARLSALSERLAQDFPAENGRHRLAAAGVSRLSHSNRPGERPAAAIPLAGFALAMALCLLLVACLNLANMMLARGSARRREIAVRLAVGAGRGRVLRQLLTEGLLLAVLGGLAGILLSVWATNALAALAGSGMRSDFLVFNPLPDARVFGASLGFCVLATLMFAFGPAWRLARVDVNADLKGNAAELPDGRGPRFFLLRNGLVVSQVALSLSLLVAGAMFARSALRALEADPGFSFGSNFYAQLRPQTAGYDEPRTRQLYRSVVDAVEALPGVEAASFGLSMPFGNSHYGTFLRLSDTQTGFAYFNVVGMNYFRTLGVPLLRGREFTRAEVETTNAHRVAIVSQSLAERFWPGEEPIGRQLALGSARADGSRDTVEVIGVVPDLKRVLMDKQHDPFFYVPYGQDYRPVMLLQVRVAPGVDPASLMHQTRELLRRLEPQLPVTALSTLREAHQTGDSVGALRLGARIFGAFGCVALVLAAVGLYGVKAYSVSRRTREIGIRMALGAASSNVLLMILGEGARLMAAGLGLGLLLAWAVGKLTARFIYDTDALDLPALSASVVVLLSAALLACWLPARRAAKVDPMVALRSE